jgi:hypothetical protein
MLVFVLWRIFTTGSALARRHRFSACAGSTRFASPASLIHQSRNFGAAFHSPATALSPPLRGQRSRPAPSISYRKIPRSRSIHRSFAPFGFEADTGRYPRERPVFRVRSAALFQFAAASTPLWVLRPSGSKRSTALAKRSSSCETFDKSLVPLD